MKFVNDATAKDTAFIKCFPDDSGVYARVLTETELDTIRVKSRTFNGNEKRTPELMDRSGRRAARTGNPCCPRCGTSRGKSCALACHPFVRVVSCGRGMVFSG